MDNVSQRTFAAQKDRTFWVMPRHGLPPWSPDLVKMFLLIGNSYPIFQSFVVVSLHVFFSFFFFSGDDRGSSGTGTVSDTMWSSALPVQQCNQHHPPTPMRKAAYSFTGADAVGQITHSTAPRRGFGRTLRGGHQSTGGFVDGKKNGRHHR